MISLKTTPSKLFLWGFLLFILSQNAWAQTISQTFNSNGSFTVPCGVTSISVQAWGGGGGGAGDGNNGASTGGGGGSGGFNTGVVAVTPGTIINYTVGAGGAGGCGGGGGCPAAGGPGGAGGATTFSTISALGGNGGAANNGAGGAAVAGGAAGSAGANNASGAGGTNPNAGGAGGTSVTTDGNGVSGAVPGGGGSGANHTAGGTNTGGIGGGGRIIITYTIPSAGTDQTLAACATSTTLAATTPPAGTGTWSCVSGCAGVTITSPNSPTSTVSGLTVGTNTVLRWTTSGGGCISSTDDVTINTTAGPGCWIYCASTNVSTTYFIRNVTFSTINNTSTNTCASMYCNFTSQSTTVTAGTTIPISVTAQSGSNNGLLYVWFDWNNDGDYTDAGEQFFIGTIPSGGAATTLTANIPIPTNATIGTTNFRVNIQRFDDPTQPCNPHASGFGETEDYALNILPDPCAMTTPNAGTDQNLALCATSTNLAGNTITQGTGTWTLVSGSGTIADPNNPTTAVSNLGSGANVFQWTVTPPGGCFNAPLTDQVTITTNGFSTANAGPDQGTCATTTTLVGNNLTGGATGLWSVNPLGPTFSSPTTPSTNVSGMVPGTTYTFRWTVTNTCGPISDQMQVVVSNTVSTANAGPDQSICPASTSLNAVVPVVGNGQWSYVSGPAGSNISSTGSPTSGVTNLVTGTYVFRWTVTHPTCPGSSSDNVTVTVGNCQNPISHNALSDQTVTGCNFRFTDNGGAAGTYAEGIVSTQTVICPDQPNQYVSITFTALDLGINEGDNLIIFTSDNMAAPIYRYADGVDETGIPLNTTIVSDQQGECLIVQFSSSQAIGASTGSGWVANTGCTTVAPAPAANPYINSTNCSGGGGITLCQDGTINPSTSFQGGQMDLNLGDVNGNNGCFGEGESNEVWVYMTVVPQVNPADPPGYISFSMKGANGQDFDFAIWGPYDYLECPVNNGDAPIRCSWAATGQGGQGGECAEGDTGYVSDNGTPQNDLSEPSGACSVPAGVNDGWVLPIDAQIGDVYIMLVNNYGQNNANFTFDYTGTANLGCDPVLLATHITDFKGYNAGRRNVLNWTTTSEKNVHSFVLERSTNGYEWTTLHTVAAQGNSETGAAYTEYDDYPYSPKTYYRVKQLGTDGSYYFTKTIVVELTPDFRGLVSELFPNPTSDAVSFIYSGTDNSQPVRVEIINSIGQTIQMSQFERVATNEQLTIQTQDLYNGIYYVAISQGETRVIKKLSIVRY